MNNYYYGKIKESTSTFDKYNTFVEAEKKEAADVWAELTTKYGASGIMRNHYSVLGLVFNERPAKTWQSVALNNGKVIYVPKPHRKRKKVCVKYVYTNEKMIKEVFDYDTPLYFSILHKKGDGLYIESKGSGNHIEGWEDITVDEFTTHVGEYNKDKLEE